MTGAGLAQQTINSATKGVDDEIKGLDRATDDMSNYYRNLGKKNMVSLFGDIFSPNFKVGPFKPPKAPSKIEVDYDDD